MGSATVGDGTRGAGVPGAGAWEGSCTWEACVMRWPATFTLACQAPAWEDTASPVAARNARRLGGPGAIPLSCRSGEGDVRSGRLRVQRRAGGGRRRSRRVAAVRAAREARARLGQRRVRAAGPVRLLHGARRR